MTNSYNRSLLSLISRRYFRRLVFLFLLANIPFASTLALSETRYHTGLEAERGRLAVSPDGTRVVFTTDRLAHGMRLLDTETGKITTVPTQAGRNIGFASWSPDGALIAAVSADTHTGYYGLDDMKIVLLDTKTWQERILVAGEGVKFDPFFSMDGKTVYYFKGIKRTEGKTPASRYDLFAVDIESRQERRLTHEEYFNTSSGHDDGKTIFFEAEGGKTLPEERDMSGLLGRWPTLLTFDKESNALSTIRIERGSGLFNFYTPKRDKAGNLYFIAAKRRPGGGFYLWYLARSAPNGALAATLAGLPISMKYDIARNTGAIFVMDLEKNEVILRKLDVTAAH